MIETGKAQRLLTWKNLKIVATRGITRSLIQQRNTLLFFEGFQNLFFIGGTGAGKSFLAQAIGHECCGSVYETYFIPLNRLRKSSALNMRRLRP